MSSSRCRFRLGTFRLAVVLSITLLGGAYGSTSPPPSPSPVPPKPSPPYNSLCQVNPFEFEGYPSYLTLERTTSPPSLNTEYCNYKEENAYNTTAQMVARCERFCTSVSILALIGSSTFGLSFTQAAETVARLLDSSVANALFIFSRYEYEQCLANRNAFHAIKQYGALFVGQLDEFAAVVLLYRQSIQDTIDAAILALNSDAIRNAIQAATGAEETIQVIVRLYQDAISTSHVAAQQAMENKLTALSDAASELRTQLDTQVVNTESFVLQCTSKLWPPSDGRPMLDVCTQKGTKCFKVADAEHVLCGCLVNLAVEVGKEMAPSTILGRRLAPESASSIDVCAVARQSASAYVASVTAQLGDSAIFAEHASVYGSFYCGAVDASASGRRLGELFTEQAPAAERQATHPAHAAARELQSTSTQTCAANPFADEGYPAFFSLARDGATNSAMYCNYGDETAYETTSQMVARCEQFCPADSISVLLGSATFGLSFNQAVQTVARLMDMNVPNALQSFTSTEYSQCLTDRNAFHAIKAYGAAFVSKLYEFKAVVLLYQSATLDTVEHAKSHPVMLSQGLSNPDPAVRLEALDNLSEALGADELTLGEGTAFGSRLRQEGAVGRLASMLQSESNLEVQKLVVWIMGNICSDSVDVHSRESKHMLLNEHEGVCEAVVHWMAGESLDSATIATGLCLNLSNEHSWCAALVDHGAPAVLQRLAGTDNERIIRYAKSALVNMLNVSSLSGAANIDLNFSLGALLAVTSYAQERGLSSEPVAEAIAKAGRALEEGAKVPRLSALSPVCITLSTQHFPSPLALSQFSPSPLAYSPSSPTPLRSYLSV